MRFDRNAAAGTLARRAALTLGGDLRRGAATVLTAMTLILGGGQPGASPGPEREPWHRLFEVAQSYSCSPRLTCGRIGSCQQANWLLENCAWGGKLDRDGDGVPCESLC